MAGAHIVSAVAAVDATSPVVETVDVPMQRIDVVRRQHAPGRPAARMQRLRIVDQLTVRLTPRQGMAAANMVENIASRSC